MHKRVGYGVNGVSMQFGENADVGSTDRRYNHGKAAEIGDIPERQVVCKNENDSQKTDGNAQDLRPGHFMFLGHQEVQNYHKKGHRGKKNSTNACVDILFSPEYKHIIRCLEKSKDEHYSPGMPILGKSKPATGHVHIQDERCQKKSTRRKKKRRHFFKTESNSNPG